MNGQESFSIIGNHKNKSAVEKTGAVSKCHVQIEAAPLSQIVEKEMKIIQK